MKRIVSIVISILLLSSLILVPSASAQGNSEVKFISISVNPTPGSVTIGWAEQTASTIYLYRDYIDGAKPIATLKPSDTSYTDKPTPGSHSYSLMVIGKDGHIAGRSSVLPVYVPSLCENPDGTIIKLWINKKKMGVDCETKEIDAEPIIIQSNTFVSIRPIIEAVGGSLGWDGATKSVVVNLPPHSISLSIGKNIATVDGKQIQINENPEIAPIIINSRTMLPFRFIAENLEGEVSWDGAEKRIDILFPLQNEKIIERAMMGMTSLGRSSLGQLVAVKNVSAIDTDNPIDSFAKGAKVLTNANGKTKAVPLLEYSDSIGQPLKLTKLVDWLSIDKNNLKAFKVGFKSNLSSLSDFDTVVLQTSSGNIVDVSFLLAGFDVIPSAHNDNIIQYSICIPTAGTSNKKVAWNISQISMKAMSKFLSIELSNPPGCETCSRVVGNFEMIFENHPTHKLNQADNLSLVLLSSLVDFSFDISNESGMNINLEEGCGFFPGASCPDLESKFTDIHFEMRDLRPANNTSSFSSSSSETKGIFNVSGTGKASWSKDNSGKLAGTDYLSLTIEDSPRPRNIVLNFEKNDHNFGLFKVFALPNLIKLTPSPGIKMAVPILNSPSGRQAGSFGIYGDAILNVTLPQGRPAGWFGSDENGISELRIGFHKIDGSTEFDCPCGESNGIEFVNYKVSQNEGVGRVAFDVRINPDIAFQPKNSDVSIKLVRDGETISTHKVPYSNPRLEIIDETAEPGLFYEYCLKLITNGKETEEYCVDEKLQPNPWLFLLEWTKSPNGSEIQEDVLRGTKSLFAFVVTNISEKELRTELVADSSNDNWDVLFVDNKSPLWLGIPAGESKSLKLSVTPNSSISSGEECLITISAQTGLQKKELTANIRVSAPDCSFEANWEGGGNGIGNDVSPGTDSTKFFIIKNTSAKQQFFIINFEAKQNSENLNSFWSISFKSNRNDEKIYLNPDESINIPIIASPSHGVGEGETIRVKVTVFACGESHILSWKLTCRLMECSFELEWLDKKSNIKTTAETESRWNETFRIWNFSESQGAFTLEIQNEGEPILSFLDQYDITIDSGSFADVVVSFSIPADTRIGESTIIVVVDCGKATEKITRRLNIKKRKDCQFISYWLTSNSDKLSVDMSEDGRVRLQIYVKNQSNSAQLFAIKVDKNKEDWETGYEEGKLRQTFTLNPGEATNNLVIWIEGGKNTKPGDICELTVRLNACRTNEVLACKVTCVEKSDLNANFENKISKLNMKRNDMLEVINRISFTRAGIGRIKLMNYNVKWYNADQDDAYLGTLGEVKNVFSIFKDMPAWDMKYYMPIAILDKMKSQNCKRIKAKLFMTFSLTTEDENKTLITKEFSNIFSIPEN